VLEVGIVLQVPTPSALPHTWTLKWVYKELGSATVEVKREEEVETVLPTNETKEKLEIVIPTFVIKLEQAKEDEVV
jgi:hypothetical protein